MPSSAGQSFLSKIIPNPNIHRKAKIVIDLESTCILRKPGVTSFLIIDIQVWKNSWSVYFGLKKLSNYAYSCHGAFSAFHNAALRLSHTSTRYKRPTFLYRVTSAPAVLVFIW
ncbi:hypothetical protein BABINDRAFT_94833 [Babjeviella inositovora NRRL Y-12698]|uniref:Uncharacterized protein n=1 Tax=Babjeviella inositovora NRRL Y-12698 TaxID=984486 RepID=A0A1E3QJJ4_9ASCO|nr:uncharacterized protein BABINDRAFT_94833 [Babjeviella inositovora NRRL Y-12698]ODQ77865.1 hypothetical protein BABINDRAFT_94833 [Babjeviella inositovora NRRL Y-12698]